MPIKDAIERATKTAVGLLPAPMRTSLHRNAGALLKPAARRTYEDGACVVNVPLGLQLWRDRGFSPKFIVDCGAYTGQWSTMAHGIWPAATIAMVEPQSSKFPLIEKAARAIGNGATANQVLLGRREDPSVRFTEMETGSSVLEEISDVRRDVTVLSQTTLAKLSQDRGWPAIDLLKIDVQGYEIEVLAGAADLLPSISMILVECSVVRMNKGAPLVGDVVAFLAGSGFDLVDVVEVHRRPADRCTLQIDAIFARRGGPAAPSEGWF